MLCCKDGLWQAVGTIIWGFDQIMGLGYAIAERAFAPDERCCGGECERNPKPALPKSLWGIPIPDNSA